LEEEKGLLHQTYSEAILKPLIRRIPDSWGKAPGGQSIKVKGTRIKGKGERYKDKGLGAKGKGQRGNRN